MTDNRLALRERALTLIDEYTPAELRVIVLDLADYVADSIWTASLVASLQNAMEKAAGTRRPSSS